MPESEREILRSLVGKTLARIWSDGFAITLELDTMRVRVIPDEVATPTTSHPHADVTRPQVTVADREAAVSVKEEVLAVKLGRVNCVRVLSTELGFSPPNPAPAASIQGVMIPEGVEYGPVFVRRGTALPLDTARSPIVAVDVAFDAATDSGHRVTVFTDAVGFFVHAAIDASPNAGWTASVEYVSL